MAFEMLDKYFMNYESSHFKVKNTIKNTIKILKIPRIMIE